MNDGVLRFTFWLALAVVASPPGPTRAAESGAAIECESPRSGIEVLICADPKFQELDTKLVSAYRSAEEKAGDGKAELESAQQEWIKTRNACWKDADRGPCTADAYMLRTAMLQARYGLVEPSNTVTFDCNEGDDARIKAVFYNTDPATVVMTRNGETVLAPVAPAGSGARYLAENGVSLWNKGDEATVEWPKGESHACHVAN